MAASVGSKYQECATCYLGQSQEPTCRCYTQSATTEESKIEEPVTTRQKIEKVIIALLFLFVTVPLAPLLGGPLFVAGMALLASAFVIPSLTSSSPSRPTEKFVNFFLPSCCCCPLDSYDYSGPGYVSRDYVVVENHPYQPAPQPHYTYGRSYQPAPQPGPVYNHGHKPAVGSGHFQTASSKPMVGGGHFY